LIIGTPYVDIGGKSVIKSLNRPGEYCEIEYYKRGWTSGNSFRLEGEVFNSKGEVVYKIEGRWNESIFLVDNKTGSRTLAWEKEPYPENWHLMYGMTKFGL
jgi:hypothetical protein